MQSPTVLIALGVLVLLVAVVLIRGRSRRDDALTPVRLGPSWSPDDDITTPRGPARDPEALAARADAVASRTGLPRDTVVIVLDAWDEYLGVLGLGPLPAQQGRRLYDPYDPPVARRGPDGRPVPDQHRVARDVAGRYGVPEATAREVLTAVADDPTASPRTAPDTASPSES